MCTHPHLCSLYTLWMWLINQWLVFLTLIAYQHIILLPLLVIIFGKNSGGAVSACYQIIGPGHQAGSRTNIHYLQGSSTHTYTA